MQQCMSNGLKNIQAHARAYARRERLESGQPLVAYDDDSGVSGIGLTPIDDVPEQAYSPDSASGAHSTPGGSSNAGSGHHNSFSSMHQGHGTYQTYQSYQPQHGYSNSVSSTGTAGYGQPQAASSQGASPYMGHNNRLPSVGEMGINSLINRGNGQ
jgi:hypothetical protein